jgi:hypothetical protein
MGAEFQQLRVERCHEGRGTPVLGDEGHSALLCILEQRTGPVAEISSGKYFERLHPATPLCLHIVAQLVVIDKKAGNSRTSSARFPST